MHLPPQNSIRRYVDKWYTCKHRSGAWSPGIRGGLTPASYTCWWPHCYSIWRKGPRSTQPSCQSSVGGCMAHNQMQRRLRPHLSDFCSKSSMKCCAMPSRRYAGSTVTAVTWPCQFSPFPSALPKTANQCQWIRGLWKLQVWLTHSNPWYLHWLTQPSCTVLAICPSIGSRTVYYTAKAHASGSCPGSVLNRRVVGTVSVSSSKLTLLKRNRSSVVKRRIVVIVRCPPSNFLRFEPCLSLACKSGKASSVNLKENGQWRASMAEDQIDRMEKDNAKNDYDLVLGKGRSMAYFNTPEKPDDKRKSITCMHKKKHKCTTDMVAMRSKLKAGRIKHMNQNKVRNINSKSWGLMTHGQRRVITSCPCGLCTQDAYHLIIECPRHKDEICEITDIYIQSTPTWWREEKIWNAIPWEKSDQVNTPTEWL